MDAREFIDWFERQVGGEMGCRVRVLTVSVHAGGVVITFKCQGKMYIAKMKVGHKFNVSMYAYVYDGDRFIGIEKYVLRDGENFNVYSVSHGVSNNVLFFVTDGVNIDVYELQSEIQ